MAPGYNQYGNYYDPVGSQSNQPSGYTYQPSTTSASQYPSAEGTSGYSSSANYQSYGGSNTYGTHQYGSSAQQGVSGESNNRTAGAGLSSLSGQEYKQASSNRSGSAQQYDTSGWGDPSYETSYSGTNLQLPNRTQSNTSPLYASSNAPSATFGSLSYNAPTDLSQSTSTAYAQQGSSNYGQQNAAQNYQGDSGTATSATSSYQPSYVTAAQNQASTQPQRYSSPSHAVQAQQQQKSGHSKQRSRGSNQAQPSPQINARIPSQQTNTRQPSSSVEPVSTTVDPSQVYDLRAEREKKAKIEAEKRRKREAEEAARKAEEDRIAEEKRKVDEANREEEEAKRKEEEAKRKVEAEAAAAKRAQQDRKNEQRRKVREEKRQSKTAANALTQMASSGGPSTNMDEAGLTAEEAEMRAMFKKMREFNTKNPAMLAKLWEEERRSHAASSQSPQAAAAKPTPVSAHQPAPAKNGTSTALSGSTTTPAQMKSTANTSKAPAADTPVVPGLSASTAAAVNQATQQSTSLWPPGKKGLLADTAAKWLSTQNPTRTVTQAQILERLDQNPNYVQLCESLETLGLRFERAAFARELLRAVPNNSTAPQQTAKASETPSSSTNVAFPPVNGSAQQSPAGDQQKPKRPRATKAEMEQRRALAAMGIKPPKPFKKKKEESSAGNQGMVDYEMPSFSLSAAAQEVNSMHRTPDQFCCGGPVQLPQHESPYFAAPDSRPASQPAQPEPSAPPEPVKPPSPPRPPADKEEAARKRGFGDLVDLTAEDSDEEGPPKKMMQIAQGIDGPPPPAGVTNFEQSAQAAPSNGSQAFSLLAQPPRMMANTAATYQQNNGFRQAPTAQMHVKPSPVPLPAKRKGPSLEQLQRERIKGKMVVEPIMRDRVARRSTYDSRTIARDVLLATGRHPDMRALNGHYNAMQKLLGERGGMLDQAGNKADLATIRWDIIDPEPAKKAAPASSEVAVKPIIEAEDADDEEEAAATARTAPQQQTSDHKNQTLKYISVYKKTKGRPPTKRGRPSTTGSSNKASPRPDMPPSSANQAGTPRPAPANRTATPNTAPAGSSQAAGTGGSPVGYAAFTRYDENGNLIKKRGRPVGWRKNIHSREAAGLAPAKSGSGYKPDRPPAAKQEQQLREPEYQVYKCEWADCRAELHSLDTLKKHIVKVHGKPEKGSYSCLWSDCQASPEFGEIEDWMNHIDKEHLQPIAWKLGDGPRGGLGSG